MTDDATTPLATPIGAASYAERRARVAERTRLVAALALPL
jgi:hypothetical protein